MCAAPLPPASVDEALSRSAEEYINDPSIEMAWAVKAHEFAQVHMNLLCAVEPADLRLTRVDAAIYERFRRDFPRLQLLDITEESLKSPEAKQQWRSFCEGFRDDVEDYSFGTLLRLNAEGRYDSDNTILVTKVQFLALEIARNREGVNSSARAAFVAAEKLANAVDS